MNSVLRPLVILVMLITLFEKLLPEGKMKSAGKTGLGLIMLLMLVTFLSNALHFTKPDTDKAAAAIFKSEALAARGSYLDQVLKSGERQLSKVAQNALYKAGYPDAMVLVSLNGEGQIAKCLAAPDSLSVSAMDIKPLPDDFQKAIADALGIDKALIFPIKEAELGHGV